MCTRRAVTVEIEMPLRPIATLVGRIERPSPRLMLDVLTIVTRIRWRIQNAERSSALASAVNCRTGSCPVVGAEYRAVGRDVNTVSAI